MAPIMMSSSRAAVCARPSRCSSVVVQATASPIDRRALLGLAAGALAVLAGPQTASAMKITSQEFTGGLVKGGGSSPKSPSGASQEGYTLDGYPGTKKASFIPAGKKDKILAKVRAQAEAIAKAPADAVAVKK